MNQVSEAQLALTGLSGPEAARRRAANGPNEVAGKPPVSAMAVLASQFASLVVWFLIGATVVSAAIGQVADAAAIAAIVVINAIVGFVQEFRASRAIEALRSMTAPRARVVRDGRQDLIAATDVVDGDILVLEAGDIISADAAVLTSHGLAVNEAALTGESVPCAKQARTDQPADDDGRGDKVFMGTAVTTGSAIVEVLHTGMATELGTIAKLVTEAKTEETPLQRRVAQLTRTLIIASCAAVIVIAVISAVRGLPATEIFLTAVSLAVAAVPEGLPAIVTVALALGVRRMAKRHVLVRKLAAVETLGCTTVICTDKTGTLTTGVMVVRDVWGSDPRLVLDHAAACCDAEPTRDGQTAFGDPTEVAIVTEAASRGIQRSDIEATRTRVLTIPFDDQRRRMAIQRSDGVLYVKGALESVLALCTSGAEGATEANEAMAARGLRVLAVATGHGASEANLHLSGLIGIADPPRPEAIQAVAEAKRAGIVTVMITGDHALTAQAIGRELGIIDGSPDDAERVHARATPARKLEIVRAYKERNAIVAMTGDGVNDAPALREANIGIAMGKGGTAVAREASDIVLANDDFASIVHGVREGRGIFEAIRRAVVYLLSGNVAELGLMLTASFAGWAAPLLPIQLLWINLATDGLPALALLTLPPDAEVMNRAPRPTSEAILGRREWLTVATSALLQTSASAGFYAWALAHRDVATARSMTFCLVVLCELFRALARLSPDTPRAALRASHTLIAVVATSAVVQLALYYIPATRAFFTLVPLGIVDVAMCGGLAALVALTLDSVTGLRGRQ